MPSRDELLTFIQLRTARYEQWRDPEDILDEQLSDVTRQLTELIGTRTSDLEAVYACAQVHWYRSVELLQRDEDATRDARWAIALFGAVHQVAPERVPQPLRAGFEAPDPSKPIQVVTPEEVMYDVLTEMRTAVAAQDAAAVSRCIGVAEWAIGNISREHDRWPSFAGLLSVLYGTRHEFTEAVEDLDTAISWGLTGARAARPDHPERAMELHMLAQLLERRHRLTGHADDLDSAVNVSRSSLAALAPDDPERPVRLGYLSKLLVDRHARGGLVADLDDAISAAREACAGEADQDRLGALRDCLARRFNTHPTERDIAEITDLDTRLLQGTPPGSVDEIDRLLSLIESQRHRQELTVSAAPEQPDTLIALLRRSLNRTTDDRAVRAVRLTSLAVVLADRFRTTGGASDLEEAHALLDEAAGLTEEGDSWHDTVTGCRSAVQAWRSDPALTRADLLHQEAGSESAAYAQSGNLPRLNRAIALGIRAIEASDSGEPPHGEHLLSLANDLLTRHITTGQADDVQHALRLAQEALDHRPSVELRPEALHMLGRCLNDLFGVSGEPADLDAAYTAAEQATAEALPGSARRPAFLNSLAGILLDRYQLTGGRSDLDRAVAALREARSLSDPQQHIHATLCTNLAVALTTVHKATGDAAALTEAIDLHRRVAGEARSAVDPAGALNLGNALLLRHLHSRASTDLTEAVATLEGGLARTPSGHPAYVPLRAALRNAQQHQRSRINNLQHFAPPTALPDTDKDEVPAGRPGWQRLHLQSVDAWDRYGVTENLGDLERAIDLARRATAAVPASHIREARLSAQLAYLLTELFGATGDREHLTESIGLFRSLLPKVPGDSPELGEFQALFAATLATHYRATSSEVSLAEAVDLYSRVAHDHTTEPHRRIRSATKAGTLLTEQRNWESAADLLELAVDLLPTAASAELEPTDQQYEMTGHTGLAGTAAACALELGDVERAVSLLERGRSVLAAQALGEPADPVDLRAIAAQGPVVVLNMSRFRCDAILLTADGADVLPLPQVDRDITYGWCAAILIAGNNAPRANLPASYRTEMQKDARRALAEIWDQVVAPVLDLLGITEPPEGGEPQRIWWVPTGPFVFLPLHAAGPVDAPGALDRAVSSYAPTLRTLRRARERAGRIQEAGGMLIVSLPETEGHPGAARLEHALRETEVLLQRFPGARLLGPYDGAAGPASPENVLAELPGTSVVHFACHTQDDWTFPLRTRILLSPDLRGRPGFLTVQDIVELRLDNAWLAFHSACATARTPTFRLLDEALNMAGAFQLAGFPHVIGTLWEVADSSAAEFAADCYAQLSPAPQTLAPHRAAYAVHTAARALRARYPEVPTRWAAHIHVGP